MKKNLNSQIQLIRATPDADELVASMAPITMGAFFPLSGEVMA